MKKDYRLYYELDYKPTFRFKGTDHLFSLSASPLDKDWTKPGQVFLTMNDDGNGLNIVLDGKKKLRLTYSEAEILRLALKINNPTVGLSEVTEKRIK